MVIRRTLNKCLNVFLDGFIVNCFLLRELLHELDLSLSVYICNIKMLRFNHGNKFIKLSLFLHIMSNTLPRSKIYKYGKCDPNTKSEHYQCLLNILSTQMFTIVFIHYHSPQPLFIIISICSLSISFHQISH